MHMWYFQFLSDSACFFALVFIMFMGYVANVEECSFLTAGIQTILT